MPDFQIVYSKQKNTLCEYKSTKSFNKLIIFKHQMTFNIISKTFIQHQEQTFCAKKLDQIPKINKKGRELVWNGRQNLIYAQFLDDHQKQMQTQTYRRRYKTFTILSKLLKTRNSDQCRSHHQKMMITHKNMPNISLYIKKKYDPQLKKQRDFNKSAMVPQIPQMQDSSQLSLETYVESLTQQIQAVYQSEHPIEDTQPEQSMWNILQEGILSKSKRK